MPLLVGAKGEVITGMLIFQIKDKILFLLPYFQCSYFFILWFSLRTVSLPILERSISGIIYMRGRLVNSLKLICVAVSNVNWPELCMFILIFTLMNLVGWFRMYRFYNDIISASFRNDEVLCLGTLFASHYEKKRLYKLLWGHKIK